LQGGSPEYPNVLRSHRITGTVDVQVTIDATGQVTNATAVSGPGPLREVAARAVRSWRYQPATINGVQTASTTMVSFHFGEK
jgi:TonB family protein